MCRGSGGSGEIFEELKRRRSSFGRTPSEVLSAFHMHAL